MRSREAEFERKLAQTGLRQLLDLLQTKSEAKRS